MPQRPRPASALVGATRPALEGEAPHADAFVTAATCLALHRGLTDIPFSIVYIWNQGFMNGQHRRNVRTGVEVDIILKEDQGSDKLTRGIVKDILTKSSFHTHGIKVRLVSGKVGRVQEVFDASDETQ